MSDRFLRKFDVQTSYKPSNYVLELIFVVNTKFPRATCHTIVPLTEELYCLNEDNFGVNSISIVLYIYECNIIYSSLFPKSFVFLFVSLFVFAFGSNNH